MAVPILQTIVGLVLVLLGIDTAKTPPTTKAMIWLYRGMFLVLGLLLMALSWIQYRNFKLGETNAALKIQVLSARSATNPATASEPVERVKVVPDPNQVNYQHKYEALLNALTTNTSLDPNVREQLIITKAQMGHASAGAVEVADDSELAAAQAAREKILPYFDYGIKTLAAISAEEGRVKLDRSILTYPGLPPAMSAEAQAGARARTSAAEVKLQNNPQWDFKVDLVETARPRYEANLTVTCAGGFLLLKSAGDAIETKVETTRGDEFQHKPASGAEAKTNIADAMGKLIASELDAAGFRK